MSCTIALSDARMWSSESGFLTSKQTSFAPSAFHQVQEPLRAKNPFCVTGIEATEDAFSEMRHQADTRNLHPLEFNTQHEGLHSDIQFDLCCPSLERLVKIFAQSRKQGSVASAFNERVNKRSAIS